MSKAMGALALLLGATLLVGCGEEAESGDAAGECAPESTSLRFGVHTEVRGFDVVNGGSNGVAGGHERSAVFDTLMQYEESTGEFVPRMAESFEPDDTFGQWTLTLRDGITFASGNPVTTDAVKFSVERHGAADTVSLYKSQMDLIESMEILSPTEMVFHLTAPQGDFPSVFASAPGMLADPAVFEELGAEEFGLNPQDGAAGPYQVSSFTQGEELTLTRRDDYWGEGEFCVGTLNFVFVENEEARRDSFLNGELDLAIFNTPSLIDDVSVEDVETHMSVGWGTSTLLINHGTGGTERPGADLRVRQAIALALDPELINERSTGGAGIASSALFTDRSQLWSEELVGPAYDPEQARTLLADAKRDGFDGKVTLSCDNAPAKVEWALAVEGLLESVGFEVELDNARALADHRNLFFAGDYELSCFAMNVDETQPWATVQTTLGQDPVAQSRVGYRSPAMGAAMDDLRAAGTVADRQAAVAAMQEVWNAEIPMAITGHSERGAAWHPHVEGLRFLNTAIALFDDVRVTTP